jgi:AraC-like DNA-binding protein
MDVSPSFELIRSQGNAFLFAELVHLPRGATERVTPVHFHPQAELVWFRKVAGSVLLDGVTYPLRDRQAVVLPPMQVHAFRTGTDARDWVLLQFEPVLDELVRLPIKTIGSTLPLILSPDAATAARLDFLCDWLCAISRQPDRSLEAQHLLSLILVTLAATPSDAVTPGETLPSLSGPLQEILRRIHADPQTAPPLSQAARATRVTDAHFSRQFKARVGMGYAAYVQMHRLNVAARYLLSDPSPVSQIAYRVGFASAAHFSTAFAERFGLSPSSFRLRAAARPSPLQETESD